jgi:hypothetical protein
MHRNVIAPFMAIFGASCKLLQTSWISNFHGAHIYTFIYVYIHTTINWIIMLCTKSNNISLSSQKFSNIMIRMLEPSLLVNRNTKKGMYSSYHFRTPYNQTRQLHILDILTKAVNKCLFLKAY